MRSLFTFLILVVLFFPVCFATPKTPVVCLVKRVTSSTFLVEKKYSRFSYHPINILDNNIKTAWFEGSKGKGVGEYIELEFFTPINISRITINNGYSKSSKLFNANGRVKAFELYSNGSYFGKISLRDTIKQQMFSPNISNVKRLRLKISETYSGTKYEDTGISELKIISEISRRGGKSLNKNEIESVLNSFNNGVHPDIIKNSIGNILQDVKLDQFSAILSSDYRGIGGAGDVDRTISITEFVLDYPRLVPILLNEVYSHRKSFYQSKNENLNYEVVNTIWASDPTSIPFVYYILETEPDQVYWALVKLLTLGDTRIVPRFLELLKEWEGYWDGFPCCTTSPYILLKKHGDLYSKNYIYKFLKRKNLPQKLSDELRKVIIN